MPDFEIWDPKFPEFARDLRAGKLNPADAETDDAGFTWVAAPSTSHLKDFAFLDAADRAAPAGRIARLGGYSKIVVRFLKKSGGHTRYTYSFSDFAQARLFWEKLTTAAHPGEVIHEMIAAAIPYERDY